MKMEENPAKPTSVQQPTDNLPSNEPKKKDKLDALVKYDEELGEENVELVDSEWADFERALR